jgi:hypothetical protein
MTSGASFQISEIAGAWNTFFHAPISPMTLALFRIALGLLLLADFFHRARSADFLYGPRGVLDHEMYMRVFSGRYFSVFNLLPPHRSSVQTVFALYFVAIFCVLLGVLSQVAAFAAFALLVSIQRRNPFTIHSGDVAMRLMLFFLAFSPSGAVLSIDTLIGLGGSGLIDPWAQRLMQITIAMIYFKSMYWKLFGKWWRQGSAVYYVLNVARYQRFRLPAILDRKPFYVAMTWGTIVMWGSLATLIWVDELRYPVMLIGLFFHLVMDLLLKIRLFQWAMITGLVLFIKPEDVAAILHVLGI